MNRFLLTFGAFLLSSSLANASWGSPGDSQYHIQTDEGDVRYFRYQTDNGQFRKEKRLKDGTVIGTDAWIDALGFLRQKDYIADNAGYRILKSKTVFVGQGRPIDEAMKEAKYAPPEGNSIVSSTPAPILRTSTLSPVTTSAVPILRTSQQPAELKYYHFKPPSVQIRPHSEPLPSIDDNYIASEVVTSRYDPVEGNFLAANEPNVRYITPKTHLALVSTTPATPSRLFEPPKVEENFLLPSVEDHYGSSTLRPLIALPSTAATPFKVSPPNLSVFGLSSTHVPHDDSSTLGPITITSTTPSPNPPIERVAIHTPPPPPVIKVASDSPIVRISPAAHGFRPYFPSSTARPLNALPSDQKSAPKRIYSHDFGSYKPYDGESVTGNGFKYFLPRHYHEEANAGPGQADGSFGYIDPFGIRRVVYYNVRPGSGFRHRKNNRYVGFNATPYDPRPPH